MTKTFIAQTRRDGLTRWCRGTFCIFCRSRTGTDRFGQLWRLREQASALPLVPRRFDTAILSPDALVYVPSRGQMKAIARGLQQRALQHWLLPPAGAEPRVEELAAGRRLAVRLPPALAHGKDNAPFRCRCASSCLRKEQMLPS